MLAYRYASEQMRKLWEETRKISLMRRMWIALAEAQMECGLSLDQKQIDQMHEKVDSFAEDPREMHRLSVLEEETKHDVMAHIRLFGETCPLAKDIIHLGATSCDITDNVDLILIRESLRLVRHRLVGVISSFGTVAEIFANLPCLGSTHYQPAQLTTVGKRVCLWLTDLVSDYEDLEYRLNNLKFRGLKGATGTQDSFLRLLGDPAKVTKMENSVALKMGFTKVYQITGQTYSRKVESGVMSCLSALGQTAHKIGCDMRLMQHDGELHETSSDKQVGSSAMAQKRNPMRAERLCSLSRYLINESHNFEMTAMSQWLERTLDDSAVRRISLPNMFLAADGVLRLLLSLSNVSFNRTKIFSRIEQELPFLLCEPIIMEVSKRGIGRQDAHETLRELCRKVSHKMESGEPNTLWDELKTKDVYCEALNTLDKNPRNYIGKSATQVKDFLSNVVEPIKAKYPDSVTQKSDVTI